MKKQKQVQNPTQDAGGSKKKKKSHRGSNLLLLLILLIGAAIAGYPAFSEYWNSMHQSRAIMGYAERVAELSNEEYMDVWNDSLEYNRKMASDPNPWDMTDEEMADEFSYPGCPEQSTPEICRKHTGDCKQCWLDWLKQEVKDNA